MKILRASILLTLILSLILCLGSCLGEDKAPDGEEGSSVESSGGEQESQCTHDYAEEITKAATCTAEGEKKLTCEKCGEVKTEKIEKAMHKEVALKAVAATCTATGLTEGKRCSECKATLVKQNVTPMLAHSFTVRKEDASHKRDNSTYWYGCSTCGAVSDKSYWTKTSVTGSAKLEYTYDVSTRTASLKGIGQCTDKAVKIPNYVTATVNGTSYTFTVTGIAANAFVHTDITSVTVPDSVTGIGDGAFFGCSSLEAVTLPNSVASIGGDAFYNCTALKSITIPDSVTSIGDRAFRFCTSLKSVTLGSGVSVINLQVFSGCSSLEGVTIPDSVVEIKSDAFSGCTALSRVTFGKNVATVGEGAFENCVKLTSVTLSNKMTVLGKEAFAGCTSLKSVNLGSGLSSIGYGAFNGCTALESVTVPKTVIEIGAYAFQGCSKLSKIAYAGAQTEWDGIYKDFKWDDGTGKYIVECT